MAPQALLLLLLLLLAIVVHTESLYDVCVREDAMPKLYHEYGEEACPPHLHLDEGGVNCMVELFDKIFIRCGEFYQMRTTFYYGREQKYLAVPDCRAETMCKLTGSDHQTFAWELKGNINVKWKALTIGVSDLPISRQNAMTIWAILCKKYFHTSSDYLIWPHDVLFRTFWHRCLTKI
jgi:hypothetical protein